MIVRKRGFVALVLVLNLLFLVAASSGQELAIAAVSNNGVINNYEHDEDHDQENDLLNHDDLNTHEHDDMILDDLHHDPADLHHEDDHEHHEEESQIISDLDLKEKIIFLSNFTKCKMFTKKCLIRLIVTDATVKWTVRSSDRKIMDVSKTEPCNFSNTSTSASSFLPAKSTSSAPLFLSATTSSINSSVLECMSIEKLNRNKAYTSRNFYLIRIKPKLVGIKYMEFVFTETGVGSSSQIIIRHKVVITSPDRLIDTIQMVYVVFFSVVIAVIMGILIDLETLIKIIKMPVSVIIGFISQYLFMPLLSFAFIKIFKLAPVEALALFIYGCSPGGSASNNWTIIFDGDIDLSAIMTFVSTMSSIFMMPLWFYTIGRTLSKKAEISIPLFRLILNLLLTIFPCLIGVLLSRRFPNLKKFFMKYAKNIVLVLIVSFLVIIFIAKYYVLSLVTWQQWLTGPLIPWSGFALGAFLAWLAKRPAKQIYTISIETGLQNVGIAYMIVMLNFPSPESDYALLPLVAISSITTVPLWCILFAKTVYQRVQQANENRKGKELNRGNGGVNGEQQEVLYTAANKEAAAILFKEKCLVKNEAEVERLNQQPPPTIESTN